MQNEDFEKNLLRLLYYPAINHKPKIQTRGTGNYGTISLRDQLTFLKELLVQAFYMGFLATFVETFSLSFVHVGSGKCTWSSERKFCKWL